MKNKLFVWLFVFSIGLNMAVFVFFGCYWYREKMEENEKDYEDTSISNFIKELSLSESQIKTANQINKTLAEKIDVLESQLENKQNELTGLLMDEKTDRKKIDAKVNEIAEAQKDLQTAIINSIFQQKDILNPEQKNKFFKIVERELRENKKGGER